MAILFYLWESIFPFRLLPIYPQWQVNPPQLEQFLPWPILVAAGCGLWSCRGTAAAPTLARHAIFGLGFFLLMVAPVLGFITISYMRITWAADHFIYLPMIGVIPLVTAPLARFYEQRTDRDRMALSTGIGVVLAVLAMLAFRYAGCWVNEDALWTHTLTYNENAWQAHNRLGAKKFSRGHVDTIAPGTRVENLGARKELQRDFEGDAEKAFVAAEEAGPVGPQLFAGSAAKFHDLAGGEHSFEAEDVIGRHAVFEAVGAAGVEGHVAADRANRLTGRIWGVIETVGRGGGGDSKIDDSRFNDGGCRCGRRLGVRCAVAM
jgi:hypothetical protein